MYMDLCLKIIQLNFLNESDATIKSILKKIPILKNESTYYKFTEGIPVSNIQYTTYGLNPNLIYTIIKYNNDYLVYAIDYSNLSTTTIVDTIIYYIMTLL